MCELLHLSISSTMICFPFNRCLCHHQHDDHLQNRLCSLLFFFMEYPFCCWWDRDDFAILRFIENLCTNKSIQSEDQSYAADQSFFLILILIFDWYRQKDNESRAYFLGLTDSVKHWTQSNVDEMNRRWIEEKQIEMLEIAAFASSLFSPRDTVHRYTRCRITL